MSFIDFNNISFSIVPQTTEKEFLKWVYENADFDKAGKGFVSKLNKRFEKETGKKIPLGYLLCSMVRS
jgi:hypothetical protein